MKTFHITFGMYKPFLIALAIVAFFSLAARLAFASEPTPQQKAAAELPEVQQEIDATQEAADRNFSAKTRKLELLKCILTNDCSFLTGTTPAL